MRERNLGSFFVGLLFAGIVVAHAADEEVTFKSGEVTLSGTLLLPKGRGLFPVVIFIHGSGPETRSNSKSRAKKFVANGYAALIYDKRGVGKSEGDPDFHKNFSLEILAEDVVAAAQYLSTRAEIDSKKIGLVAASQGGWVAPLVAYKFRGISFMIIISGSVSSIGEDNVFERNARLLSEGFSETQIKEVTEMHLVDLEVSRSGNEFDKYAELWNKYKEAPWFKRVYLSEKPMGVDHPYRKWYKTVVDFSPIDYLKDLEIPVLWIYGESGKDRFCPVELSLERLQKMKSDGKDYEIITLKDADHSLMIKSKDVALEQPVFEWLTSKLSN